MTTDQERELSRRLHQRAETVVPDGTEPPLRPVADPAARGPRPSPRWRWPALIAAAVVAIVAIASVAVLTLRDDDTASTPDVSSDGRLAYACALALDADARGPVDTWNITVGNDADPALAEVMGAAGLLGGARGDPGVFGDLSSAAADLYQGVTRLNFDIVQAALDRLATGCTERGLPAGEVDTSSDGRLAYVCALADDIQDRPGSPDSWRPISLENTDPVWFEVDGVVGLLGAPMGMDHPQGRPGLSGIGPDIYAGAARQDDTRLERGLDHLVAQCHPG